MKRPRVPKKPPPPGEVCSYCVEWKEPDPKPAEIFCSGCGKWYCRDCLMMH